MAIGIVIQRRAIFLYSGHRKIQMKIAVRANKEISEFMPLHGNPMMKEASSSCNSAPTLVTGIPSISINNAGQYADSDCRLYATFSKNTKGNGIAKMKKAMGKREARIRGLPQKYRINPLAVNNNESADRKGNILIKPMTQRVSPKAKMQIPGLNLKGSGSVSCLSFCSRPFLFSFSFLVSRMFRHAINPQIIGIKNP